MDIIGMRKIRNTFEFIDKNGMLGFVKECYYRPLNIFFEKYFNVNTKGLVSKKELGITNPDSVEYSSVSYRHIFKMLNKVPVDKNDSTLLDYGCGKGRVIICAASYRYKNVIGVELSGLISVANHNVNVMKHRKTKKIVLEQCDARDYRIPIDVNVIFFFNPFRGLVLEDVIDNIYTSYKENPRKIYIIYFNNDHFDKIIKQHRGIVKTYQSQVHLNVSCGLYEFQAS